MTRPLDVLLNKDARIAEVIFPQPHDGVEGIKKFRVGIADAHADPAPARGALQHHRVADLLCRAQRLIHVRQQFGALQHRHALGICQRPGGVFQAKQAQLLRRRADEGDTRSFAGFGKGGVLG